MEERCIVLIGEEISEERWSSQGVGVERGGWSISSEGAGVRVHGLFSEVRISQRGDVVSCEGMISQRRD